MDNTGNTGNTGNMRITHEQLDAIGKVVDSLDNIIEASNLPATGPMPAEFHVRQMREALLDLSRQLKDAIIQISGGNPWG